MVFIHSRGSLVLLTTSLLVILSILIQPVYGARYVFTAFTSTSESNMFVYTSTDATNFSLLKGPAYQPNGTLIRDPSPLLHTDGRYYISYTTSWENRMFAIASSANLLDWKLHTTVQIPDTTVARMSPPFPCPEYFLPSSTPCLHPHTSRN